MQPTLAPPSGASALRIVAFRLEDGLPIWTLATGPTRLEKRAVMVRNMNTIALAYRLLSDDGPVSLRVAPTMAFRRLEDPVSTPLGAFTRGVIGDGAYEFHQAGECPPLRLWCPGSILAAEDERVVTYSYPAEALRGYDASGELWCPGIVHVELQAARQCLLAVSTEKWSAIRDLTADGVVTAELARRAALVSTAGRAAGMGHTQASSRDRQAFNALVLAADEFIVTSPGSAPHRAGSHPRSVPERKVIAGYHWFNAWGRDTMISLEGLALITGRHEEAAAILRTFARHARRGLIPNFFPEGSTAGVYHTADATLWFVHALHRHALFTGERELLREMLPLLVDIVAWHVHGTDFNIGVGRADGLLSQGMDGFQLTWMDAKVGDWVVTPRQGKAVEIQGLWYNALRLIEGWVREEDGDIAARPYGELAAMAERAFNERFWFAEGGYLHDVVDGPDGLDSSCRPNQLLAFSLAHPVLDRARWRPVLDVVTQRLLTPVGLRSLAPGSPGYQPRYEGDLRTRDAAYHQGTVWPWLIGPYADAWKRVHSQSRVPRVLLDGLLSRVDSGLGQLPEIFDAETPYAARGCIAQAWSVAEVLRCLVPASSGHVSRNPSPTRNG